MDVLQFYQFTGISQEQKTISTTDEIELKKITRDSLQIRRCQFNTDGRDRYRAS
jgi:hypothetical protein